MNNPTRQAHLQNLSFILCGALILMGAAFYNGYPLVYADTGTYLNSGFEMQVPMDRPITYGIFIRIFSFNGMSLWSVIFFQSLILSYLIFECFRQFTPKENAGKNMILATLLLSCFTGISWIASQIIGDVFTPICALAAALIFFAPDLKRSQTIFILILFFVAVATHVSHLVILFVFSSLLFAKHYFQKKKKKPTYFQWKRAIFIPLFSVLAFFTMSSSIGKSGHIFMMSRLVETGIIDRYLDDNCGKKQLELCRFKDSLPHDAATFMWKKGGPLEQMGGWKNTKAEFNGVISDVFTTPKYFLPFGFSCLTGTLEQVLFFRTGEGLGAYPKGDKLYDSVKKYVPYELKEYEFSLQGRDYLPPLENFNFCAYVFMGIAIFLLVYMMFQKTVETNTLRVKEIVLALVLFILVNNFTCTTFSTISNRFGCRVMWLLPLFLIILYLNSGFKRKNSASAESTKNLPQ
jgi:hypothetical protein